MNRRKFIGAMGGLIAVSALPGCQTFKGEDRESVFAKRGKFERLIIGGVNLKIGATEPFSILHISDTHFTSAYDYESKEKRELAKIRTQTFGGKQEEALRDSLDWAKLNVDYVLHTGDLIDFQSEANFDLVRKYFGGISMCAVGNHEYSPSMWFTPRKKGTTDAEWREQSFAALKSAYPMDLLFSSKVVNGINFVMIDNSFATVSENQVERFHQEVKKGLPIVLASHVPYMTENIWILKERYWRNQGRKVRNAAPPPPSGDLKRQLEDKVTKDFIAYLKSEKLLKAIFVGHEHMVTQDRFSPTAMEYAVGGNFAFHGQEILFS